MVVTLRQERGSVARPGAGARGARAGWSPNPRRAAAITALLGLTVAGLTGCSGPERNVVYAGKSADSALLVQWTNDGNGLLAGTVQIADKSDRPDGTPVQQTSLTFNGTVTSDAVALKVSEEPGRSRTWNGTLDGDDLRVELPPRGANGIERITLTRGSAALFTSEVADLEAEVITARARAARAAVVARAKADQEAAAQAVQRSFDDARGDLSAAKKATRDRLSPPSELTDLTEEVTSARDRLKQVEQNAGEAAFRSRGFAACKFATRAKNAKSDLDKDVSDLKRDRRVVEDAADDLTKARKGLSEALVRLDRLADISAQPAGPADPEPKVMIKKAKTVAKQWRAQVADSDKAVASLPGEADDLVRNAVLASC